jgi:hypothetical protein
MSAPDLIIPRVDVKAAKPAVSPARPAEVAQTAAPRAGREPRLDMFRGLALVMIFIDHVPGTFYENLTIRNFGFSDAAEAFVFMSGMAAGLAYSARFANGPLWLAIAKVWARARQLYFVHMATTAMAIAIFAGGALYFGLSDLLTKINLKPLFTEPLAAIIGLPLMTHQLGYFNILPLYIVLLLATPVFLVIGMKRPLLLLGLSVLLWAAAGQFRLNLPNYPNPGGWFFNPLSWQLIFVVGLLSGIAMKRGTAFVPFRPWLFWLCAALLAVTLLWVKVGIFGALGRQGLGLLGQAGLPFYIVGFDKTFLALPRLVHALALFYVVSCLPAVARFAAGRLAEPLKLLGRYGLPVFATGSVLSILLQAVKEVTGTDFFIDSALLAFGLAVQLGLAAALAATVALRQASTQRSSLPAETGR